MVRHVPVAEVLQLPALELGSQRETRCVKPGRTSMSGCRSLRRQREPGPGSRLLAVAYMVPTELLPREAGQR